MQRFDCSQFVEQYLHWLRESIRAVQVGEVCEITTPFLDRHNDHLQIYIKRMDEGFVLTDDSYTIQDLLLSGCDLTTERRRRLLDTILNGFGVQRIEDELTVQADETDLAQKKHNLIQAMLAVNDLFLTAQPTVAALFREDVERFLRANEVRFTPSVGFTGRSGFHHTFDFVIPASVEMPERVVKAINMPTRDNAVAFMFAWQDTKEARPERSSAVAMVNDTERPVSADFVSAFSQYEIEVIKWGEREEKAGLLTK